MANIDNEELTRLLGVFADRGWNTRDDIIADHDLDAEWEAIRDVGPERAPIMRALMAMDADEWYQATGLLPYVGFVPKGEAVVQTDQV